MLQSELPSERRLHELCVLACAPPAPVRKRLKLERLAVKPGGVYYNCSSGGPNAAFLARQRWSK